MKCLVFPLLVVLACSGCVLHSSPFVESYDGLDGPVYAEQVKTLAAAVSERISIRYPQALIYVEAPSGNGVFGDALRYALGRNSALAIRKDMASISVIYALGELNPGTGYLNLRFSDGTAMAQSFIMQPTVNDAPLYSPAVYQVEEAAPQFANAVLDRLPPPEREESVTPEQEIPAREQSEQQTTLRMGVLSNLPWNWKYTIPNATKRLVRVPLVTSGNWRERISAMAEAANCRASFDENARRVSLLDTGPVPVAPENETSSVMPVALHEVQSLPVEQEPPADVLPTEPLSSPAPETAWELMPGSLYEQLRHWANKAGYQLIWKSDDDLRMEAFVTFSGDFETAIQSLFHGLHAAGNPFRVTIYSNSVLEVAED